MADLLHFSRNTKVYLKQGANIWEIPVLDGFSFSQATNSSEITLNEMSGAAGASRRARQMFNDSFAPAEWSFSTYARPHATGAVEEALWANFVSDSSYTSATNTWSNGIGQAGAVMTVDFEESNVVTLGTYDLFFVMGAVNDAEANFTGGTDVSIYKVAGCVGNSVGLDFDIDGITTLNWSGMGAKITEEAAFNATTAITTGIASTSNFIRNRLTTLAMTAADPTIFPGNNSDGVYNLVLTGGSLSFENNITFLTPETLGTVNQPLGHVTGTRNIGGSFTCYLNNGAAGSSADLFEDIIEATTKVTNSFGLTFGIGGSSAPKMVVTVPTAHLEVPSHSIEDVVSLEVNFHGLPSTIEEVDEATVVYTGS